MRRELRYTTISPFHALLLLFLCVFGFDHEFDLQEVEAENAKLTSIVSSCSCQKVTPLSQFPFFQYSIAF